MSLILSTKLPIFNPKAKPKPNRPKKRVFCALDLAELETLPSGSSPSFYVSDFSMKTEEFHFLRRFAIRSLRANVQRSIWQVGCAFAEG